MGFVGVCVAVYNYQPQAEGELELQEGELLYILEKSQEDDWWKAKKKAAEDEEEEPEGLVPNNYVEAAKPLSQAKALYDYTRQTDEEVSFAEDASLEVYDTSDPDWTLVAIDGDYGFAPANYIELTDSAPQSPRVTSSARNIPTAIPSVPEPEQEPSPPASPIRSAQGPAAGLARILGGGMPSSPRETRAISSPPLPQRELTPEPSDEEQAPALPTRPRSQTIPRTPIASPPPEQEPPGVVASPPIRSRNRNDDTEPSLRSPGGFHLYNISEMVSAMGKRKKMPITLGLNVATGTIMISPEKSRDGPTQEWTADKLSHYSIEGKHVFLELVRPSKSLDLHAGAKDTAREIVSGLGEIAGAHRAEGLKEVITAASGGVQKKGVVLYDFMAQGDDEVTVAEGDEVVVLDDTKSEEWWNVRRVRNGKEGVVPSSYIEVTGTVAAEPESRGGINAGRSTVEQNRLEEERLAKEAARAKAAEDARAQRDIRLPERGSSLAEEERRSSKKDKKSSKSDNKLRSKPDPAKTRTWTDHSGSFKVDAQFIGVADGKIHLHKANGVKIAVPISKMSPPDLEYIEKVMQESIDENRPLADIIKMKKKQEAGKSGATIAPANAQQSQTPDYDWFEFFLNAGVGVHQCERYAQAMTRDSMDESVLPDISIETLRALGLKEGDALKVMKHLDQKFNRNRATPSGTDGGIFSGPAGTLKNNTSRQRPDANRQAGDVVNADAFSKEQNKSPVDAAPTPTAQVPTSDDKGGFDDDAWTVKRPSQATPVPAPTPTAVPAPRPSENAQALSLLDKPLEPTPAAPTPPAPSIPEAAPPPQTALSQQQTGATPQFFQQVGQQQQIGLSVARQRPTAPQQAFTGSALLPPPPRPLSAPQHPQQNQFAAQPLALQLTGMPSNAHPAPAGQSMDELAVRNMQQYAQLRAQQTALQQQGYAMPNGFQPQPTGFQPQPTGFQPQQYPQLQQPYLNGNAAGSPFADPRSVMQAQPTGFQPNQLPGGINSILPPAMVPQKTGYQSPPPQMQANGFNQFSPQQQGFQPQPTGFQPQIQAQPTGYGQLNGFGTMQAPPVPRIPELSAAPLVPQKTGPAPNIKFGVPDAKRLIAQPTGRRANLSAATPQNPFGF